MIFNITLPDHLTLLLENEYDNVLTTLSFDEWIVFLISNVDVIHDHTPSLYGRLLPFYDYIDQETELL